MSNPIGPDMSLLENMYEKIDHPSHYNPDGIEAISVIEDWNLGFCLGSVIKYICRYNRKRSEYPLNDLRKARWYLDRYIEWRKVILEPKAPIETKEAKEEPKLTIADIEQMLTMIDDIEKLVLKRVSVGPVGRTHINERRANTIAKATFRAFKEAFRTEVKEQLMLNSLSLATEQELARDKTEKENTNAT